MWALRDAVRDAGYYSSGRYPADFYVALARRSTTHANGGALECYAPRATMLPVWQNHYARNLPASVRREARWKSSDFARRPTKRCRVTALPSSWLSSGHWLGRSTARDTYYVVLELAAKSKTPAVRVLDSSGNVIPSNQEDSPANALTADLQVAGWSGPEVQARPPRGAGPLSERVRAGNNGGWGWHSRDSHSRS